ncbi:DDE-type integrase/transposase/recombinase, partial [Acrocarpospora sp. B8E8]
MTKEADQQRKRAERARLVALFRYQIIQDVIDPALSARQRGARVRELAAMTHQGPFGEPVALTRGTIDRWIRWWRQGGFEALVPTPATILARTPAEVLAIAIALKKENPARTATQIRRIMIAQSGWAPSERTLQRHFERAELPGQSTPPEIFGAFEAARPNELWTGDALHGPLLAGRKTYLFAFIDDHSRAIMAARFGFFEDVVRLAAALRPALAARGVPESIYVDNGAAFVDSWLLRGCATLGIKLVHATPNRPQGKPQAAYCTSSGRSGGVWRSRWSGLVGAAAGLRAVRRVVGVGWVVEELSLVVIAGATDNPGSPPSFDRFGVD